MSVYAFTNNNPVTLTDLYGLKTFSWREPVKKPRRKPWGTPGYPKMKIYGATAWHKFDPEVTVKRAPGQGTGFLLQFCGGDVQAIMYYQILGLPIPPGRKIPENNSFMHEWYHVQMHCKPAYVDYKTHATTFFDERYVTSQAAECVAIALMTKMVDYYKTRAVYAGHEYDCENTAEGQEVDIEDIIKSVF